MRDSAIPQRGGGLLEAVSFAVSLVMVAPGIFSEWPRGNHGQTQPMHWLPGKPGPASPTFLWFGQILSLPRNLGSPPSSCPAGPSFLARGNPNPYRVKHSHWVWPYLHF